MVGMLMTKAVKEYLKQLKTAGMEVKYDAKAGTAEVKDGDVVVFKALQKGNGQPWIVQYKDGDNVKWGGK